MENNMLIEIRNSIPALMKRNSADRNWAIGNLNRRLESKFKNTHGKKASEYVQNNIFFSKREDHYVCYKAEIVGEYTKLLILLLYPIKTNGGTVYVCNGSQSMKLDCYCAHIFDQYGTRTGLAKEKREAIKNRDKIIEDWAKHYILNNSEIEIKDKYIVDYHPKGLMLGDYNELSSYSDLVLYKTFVSNEMLFRGQKILQEKLKLKKSSTLKLWDVPLKKSEPYRKNVEFLKQLKEFLNQ